MKSFQMAALAAAIGIASLAGPAGAQEARPGVGIYPVDPSAEAADSGVRVVRGSGVRRPYDGSGTARPAKAVPAAETAAGETVWLVDRKADRLVGCYLEPSLYAGNPHRIRCASRRLP